MRQGYRSSSGESSTPRPTRKDGGDGEGERKNRVVGRRGKSKTRRSERGAGGHYWKGVGKWVGRRLRGSTVRGRKSMEVTEG